MELQGKIKLINETQSFGASEFKKRDIVITTDDTYPQDILIEFVQDKTTLLDSYKVGQEVKIAINLRGREWVNPEGVAKYFNSLNGWRIESTNNSQTNTQQKEKPTADGNSEPDDLPF